MPSKLLVKIKKLVTGERVDLRTGEILVNNQFDRLYELSDPVPLAPPIGYKREPSIIERVKQMILESRVQRLQNELGAESAAESEDFYVEDDDDYEPSSLHEHDRHDRELLETFARLADHQKLMQDKYGKAAKPLSAAPPAPPAAPPAVPSAEAPPPAPPPPKAP